ncbi:MAG: phospholipase D-like domain-containing protein [Bacteroidota bacterium]
MNKLIATKPSKPKKAFKLNKISPYFVALFIGSLLSFHLTEYYYTSPHSHKVPQGEDKAIKLFFSPKGKCAAHIINTIKQAEKEIYIAIYVFTHQGIANALVSAKARGVDIHILANNTYATARYSQLDYLDKYHINIYIDNRPGVFHHKWLIVDKKTIITGSYNYTKSAEEKNNEIIGHIESRAVVEKYHQDWETHIQDPKVYRYGDLSSK